jgi:DNA polymerase III subunit delta
MIFFLYGSDNYRSKKKLEEIIEQYKNTHKKGLSLMYFDGEKLNFQDFWNDFNIISMFKEKKLAVLNNIFSNKSLKEDFLKNEKKLTDSENIVVIYEEKEIPETDLLFKSLKKNSKLQKFDFLEGEKLKNWVKEEFEKYKTKADSRVIQILINFIGNDLWQFSGEIKKLSAYKSKTKEIEEKDIVSLIKPKIESDIFKTIDALSSKNTKMALFLIHKHLEKGDNPNYLLSMIKFQFQNLLIIKELYEKGVPIYNFAKLTKIHPFVVRKSIDLSKKFTLQELKKIYQKIFQIDLEIKTGKIDPEVALDLFLTEI